MNNDAIIIRNITKSYFLEKPKTLKKWLHSLVHNYGKFVVLKNFSLKIKKGETVLIIGPNGCGKSTLLKLIAGITPPDRGTIDVHGRVVPLIALGAGFNLELTGRENININAAILGLNKKSLHSRIHKIISFAGIGEFIDVPLKRYSTGMISRLAFSIAIYSEPDILLLDELFAVGDVDFRKKFLDKLALMKRNGVTLLICTHFELELPLIDRKVIFRKRF